MPKKISLSFLLVVVIPTLLATFYYFAIASKQYQAEASFVIQGDDKQDGSILFGTLAALGGGGSSTSKDSYVVHEFISSNNFIETIKQDFDIRKSFTSEEIDWYSRLSPSATRKELLNFWQEKLNINYDKDSGITKIQITAFQPENSLKILELITSESEKIVNQLSNRSKKDRLAFSNSELSKAETKLADTRKKLRILRNKKNIVSPESAIKSKVSIITKLETNLALKEAEVSSMKDYIQPGSIKIKSLNSKIKALKIQISSLKKNITNKNDENAISNIVGDYQEILIQQEFAEKKYQSALIALESARTDASKKHRYLDIIVTPVLPDAAFYPDLTIEVPNILLFAFLFWAIGRLIIGLIKDHAGWI